MQDFADWRKQIEKNLKFDIHWNWLPGTGTSTEEKKY
jgi:hypothetical protein